MLLTHAMPKRAQNSVRQRANASLKNTGRDASADPDAAHVLLHLAQSGDLHQLGPHSARAGPEPVAAQPNRPDSAVSRGGPCAPAPGNEGVDR